MQIECTKDMAQTSGVGMFGHLRADPEGLRLGSTNSQGIATALTAGTISRVGDQASHAGVDAVNAAIESVRERQSGRVGRQADDTEAAGFAYDTTDDHTARSIAEAM